MRGMKLGVFSVMTMLALTVFTCTVLAQQGMGDKPTATPSVGVSPGAGAGAGVSATPTTQPGAVGAGAGTDMGTRGAMITPEERRQGRILLNAPIYLDSSAGLLAQADKLGLTDDQKNKLKDIQKNE